MAMRPRGGAGAGASSRRTTRSGMVRSVYEDFKPVSEWQQNDESHVLIIYLPGFNKDQIKVSTEGRDTIRVRGERLVAGNKWSRFSEDFQVPENGEMDSVRAKFQGGILTLTVKKQRAGKPQDAIDDIRKQPITQPIPQVKGDKETKQGQDEEKPFPEAEERISEPLKASAKPDNEEESREKQRGRSFTPTRDTGNAEKNKSGDTKASPVVSKKPGDVTKLPEAETAKMKEPEKSGVTSIPEKNAEDKDSHRASKQQNYKKAVRGLNEERQLLVNMGVAMLVIVALTAYVTHSFTSAKHRD